MKPDGHTGSACFWLLSQNLLRASPNQAKLPLQGRALPLQPLRELQQQQLTREAALLHEVPLELGVGEEQVVELVHAEVEHLVHVLAPIQVLVKGLDFPCGGKRPSGSSHDPPG